MTKNLAKQARAEQSKQSREKQSEAKAERGKEEQNEAEQRRQRKIIQSRVGRGGQSSRASDAQSAMRGGGHESAIENVRCSLFSL